MAERTRKAPNAWVCPNDRQLCLRAKLNIGWSYHSGSPRSGGGELATNEKKQIMDVLRNAERLEKMEQERIGRLVEKLENMRKHAVGDGERSCILCGVTFSTFGTTPTLCNDCRKGVCSKCCVDTYNSRKQPLWLCKLCSEQRELFKRSGAWFYKSMPTYIMPNKTTSHSRSKSVKSIESDSSVSSSVRDSFRIIHHRTKQPAINRDQEVSSDDEDNTLMRSDSDTDERSSTDDSMRMVDTNDRSRRVWPSVSRKERGSGSDGTKGLETGMGDETLEDTSDLESEASFASNKLVKKEPHNTENEIDLAFQDFSSQKADSTLNEDDRENLASADSGNLGSVDFSVLYEPADFKLHVTIVRAKNLKAVGKHGNDPYVKIQLLPASSKTNKMQTKKYHRTNNPEFNETLTYLGVTNEDLTRKTLRVCLMNHDRFASDLLIGTFNVKLKDLEPSKTKQFNGATLRMLSQGDLEDDHPTFVERGRIEVCLKYVTSTHTLEVGIIQCVGLKAMDPSGYSDPYVKCYLKPDKFKSTKQKTSVKKRTLNPKFNTVFKYKCSHSELAGKTLDIQVWDYDIGRKNDFIGGVNLGKDSSGDQLRHWFETLNTPNTKFTHFHTLTNELRQNTE